MVSVPAGPSGGRRNPFDSAVHPGRSLADRITVARSRSRSPVRHSDVSGPAPSNVDRYVPGRDSRSPMPRRRDGRRPGARRERGGRGDGGGERKGRDGRPKKTQEELDAEMEDYFGGNPKESGEETAPAPAEAATAPTDDVDMIE